MSRIRKIIRRVQVARVAWKITGEHPDWTNAEVNAEIERRTGLKVW